VSTPIRIVVVDDHPIAREGMCAGLARLGDFQIVGVAADGRAALRLVPSVRPDVLVLDVRLPDMSGLEVARQVRRLPVAPAILALTGYPESLHARALLREGALGYIDKAASIDEIAAAIRSVARGCQAVVSSVAYATLAAKRPVLTVREQEVLLELMRGASNAEIALRLSISIKTTEAHVGRVLGKLGARSRAQIPSIARDLGLGDSP
jgi:DNA-binding NarL/FixJ family response regulator